MSIDLLRSELERLFDLDEMLNLSRDALGYDPDAVGGTATPGSFARSLSEYCVAHDGVEALCEALAVSKAGLSPGLRLPGIHGRLRADDDLPPGQPFGAFTIVRRLGEGPSGVSYLAKLDDTDVRLKVLHRETARDARSLQQFLALTRLVARVRQRWLPVRVRVGTIAGRPYVAHDAVDAQPLSARVQRTGPMHLNEARTTLVSVLEALGALHASRIAHGNLKLGNVLVYQAEDGSPRVLLVDACSDRLHTRFGVGAVSSPGTPAPEVLRGQPPSETSDVYSFGALVFEVLTGRPPFEGPTAADVFAAHLTAEPGAPSAAAPRGWIHPDIDGFVLSLLKKDPAARPRDAAAVLELLDRLGRPTTAESSSPRIEEEEAQARIDQLLAHPDNEEAALSVEGAVSEGVDPGRVAEALLMASQTLDPSESAETRSTAVALLFRAGRLFQEGARNLQAAESAYARIVALEPGEATAQARLDDIRRRLGKYEELVESLLERAERAEEGPERAAVLSRIGSVYETDLKEPEQALVALTQAFTEDPLGEYADHIERIAGTDTKAWGEVLAACNAASTEERPVETKNALFAKMAGWYDGRYFRPDLALACHQAILATDPSNSAAQTGLTELYKKTGQWKELGALLLQRADASIDPGKARDLRCDAAFVLEGHLGDAHTAEVLFRSILASDPGHRRAADALARLLERSRNHEELVRLLASQADALRGDERLRTLCRIASIYEESIGDDEEATRRYVAVLDENPEQPEALRALDRLYSRLGRFPELLENLEQQSRIATTPRQKMALWERIAGVYSEEFLDHEKAAHAMEQVTELDPEHEAALESLARHYRALSRWEDLTTIYERLLSLVRDPGRKLVLALSRARVLDEELRSTDRALRAYDQVLELDPRHPTALQALARLRETAGHEDAALVAIDALAEDAETPEAKAEQLMRAARLLEGRGDRAGAIEMYKRALAATPKDAALSRALRVAYVNHGDGSAAALLLEREIAAADADLAKAKLLAELAELAWTKLSDAPRGEAAARRALEHDPTNTDALAVAADLCFDTQRFVEAAAYYEKLAARTETMAPETAVRALGRYVDSLAKAGSTEKALAAMDTLLALAPDDPEALSRAASVTFDHGAPARARELYVTLLTRFGDRLPHAERALASYRLGEAARRSRSFDTAVEWLEIAADLDPSNPLPLISLAETYEMHGDYVKVVEAKTRHLDLLHGDERVKLLVEIGEIAVGKLDDRPLATKSLVAALDERPDDRKLLARLLQLYSQDKDWQKLVDVVLKLADFVDDPKQKAKYLQTAGMVTFREMRDYDGALAYYDKVLSLDPANTTAMDESIELCEDRGDFAEAAERLRRKATLASDVKDTQRMLDAFNALAAVYRDKLGRVGHAIDALEAAQTLEPENEERNKILADLYASNPERYLDKAVAAQMAMLKQNPYRVESYKLLRKLFTDSARADPAWCLCQALYVLKLADAEEERFFKRMRSEDPAYAQDRMTQDDWLDLVFHPDADPMLTSLFALIEPAVAATRGESLTKLGFDERLAVDPQAHPYPVAQTLHYAAGVLGMDLPPVFENWNDQGGLGFLSSATPAIVLGTAALHSSAGPQPMAFTVGRHLTFYRPGFYVRQLLPNSTTLRAWLFAAIKLNAPQFPVAPDIEGPVQDARRALELHLPHARRDQLSRIVSKLIQSGAALDLKRWVQGLELTADRVGFILCHDLEIAVETIRASRDNSTQLAQSRLKDLVLYAISEPYFRLRRRLAIAVDS